MLANYTATVSCIWEQAKHHMNSTTGLSPISSCFCQVYKRKIHVRSSSRTKPRTHPQPQLLCSFFWCLQELDCAGSVLEVLASASNTKSHTWGAEVSVLAWFLTFFSQILIWSSHLLHYSQTVSCRSEKNWIFHVLRMLFHAFGIKTDLLVWKLAGKKNCIGNSNYYLQKLYNSDFLR